MTRDYGMPDATAWRPPRARVLHSPPAAARAVAGFTLLEVVVAVSIFAVIGVIALTGLGKMTRDGQALANANNRLSELQFAVVYFEREWAQVSPRGIRNQYGDEEANIVIADDTITFTHSGWSNLLGNRRSNLQRVQYLVDDDRLLRRYWQSLDQGIGERPVETVLLDKVESMEVSFLNAGGEPLRSWPLEASANQGQPILLALKLELPDRGDIVRLLEVPDGVF